MILQPRSLARLEGIHPDLYAVILKAAETTPVDFLVTEGVRSLERQKQLLTKGASRTMHSRHLTGHAVDLACVIKGQVVWAWPPYRQLSEHVLAVAADLAIPIEWGGNWSSFKDGPHYQLPYASYP